MKKIFVFIAAIICVTVQAQVKEGMLKYSIAISVKGNPVMNNNPLMGNSTVTVYFKNEKALSEMKTSIYKMENLIDNKGMLMLMDAGGKKFFIRKTKEEMAKDLAAKKAVAPSIAYSKETKKIMGYDCNKAIITTGAINGKIPQMTVWYTNKIQCVSGPGPVDADMVHRLNGMVMEMEMSDGKVTSKMTVTNINARPVPDLLFYLSTAGYTERKPGLAVDHINGY